MIDYNSDLLNHNDLSNSFFHLDKNDPTVGFSYNASIISGPTFPPTATQAVSPPPSTPISPKSGNADTLDLRLRLGSHLADYLRHQLEEEKGYTATVGISTNKLISKLVGNVNKPKGQTTLRPPYLPSSDHEESNVTRFVDAHDIGKIPGIGFKIAQKLRNHVLGRHANFHEGLVYGGTKENVTVRDLRLSLGMGPEVLEKLLGGPGAPKGIGGRIWDLVNGVDDTEVGKARSVPRQISIEDSYIRLDTMDEIKKELTMLTRSLIKRMHLDLTEVEDDEETSGDNILNASRRWLAHPRTLRLTTRPRPPLNPDGTRTRTFHRISRSGPMPTFVFNLHENMDLLVEKAVSEVLIPMFRKLHTERSGLNISLINVAATNMAETATDDKDGAGRDIKKLFKRQEAVLKDWKVEDRDVPPSENEEGLEVDNNGRFGTEAEISEGAKFFPMLYGSEDAIPSTQDSAVMDNAWSSENEEPDLGDTCKLCGAIMPPFAMGAHERFHTIPD